MDDILLDSSDVNMILEKKKFLSLDFDLKDLGEASFILEIEVDRDRRKRGIRIIAKGIFRKVSKEI